MVTGLDSGRVDGGLSAYYIICRPTGRSAEPPAEVRELPALLASCAWGDAGCPWLPMPRFNPAVGPRLKKLTGCGKTKLLCYEIRTELSLCAVRNFYFYVIVFTLEVSNVCIALG